MSAVHTVDLHFQGVPGVISSFVLPTEGGVAVVDPGPGRTLPTLEAGLRALGFGLEDVRHVLLTHIHLDHAGAAGEIVERSGGRVYVHERGAAHLARPARLLASAGQIYGEHMDALWGEMRPVPPERLVSLSGGETLDVDGVTLRPVASPGHAVHHLAWQADRDLLCGDVGGVRLVDAQTPRAPTPPPDIDLGAWRDSVARLRALDVERLHLAHFGSYDDVDAHWDALLTNMDLDASRVRDLLAAGEEGESLARAFEEAQTADLARQLPGLEGRMRFASPAWMSAAGLVRYWRKQESRKQDES